MIEQLFKDSPFILYRVGGSVRDELTGLKPDDYDYTTPAYPLEVAEWLWTLGMSPNIANSHLGTVVFQYQGDHIEITTLRSEVYGASRTPDVKFITSITQDLSRRDFTMNAIALRGSRYIDPFQGRSDIQAKLIRSLGNPSIKFREDPLRMLRAARFAGQLEFVIEEHTQKAIQKNAFRILDISPELWTRELDKLLMSDKTSVGLDSLQQTGLMKFILPELRLQIDYNQNSDYHSLSLWEHTKQTVNASPRNIDIRWAALLHDIAKPFVRTENIRGSSNYVFHDSVGARMAIGIGTRLRWSNKRTSTIAKLIENHLKDESPLREADNASKKRV